MSPQNNHQHSNQQKNQHSNSTHSIEERKLKVLVLGKDGVGKSALIVRYLTRRFIGEYDPYLEGVYQKTIKSTGNHFINVELKDTAMDINWSKRSKDLAWADMLIMVYSITDRSSFLEVQKVKKLVEQLHKTRGTCCMVVGNKTDMGHERAVTLLEGDSLATGMCGSFHELSVAENHIEIENKLSRAIRERFNAKYQIKSLASKSSTEIRHKSRIERPKSQPDLKALEEEAKTERRGGRALWRKFRDK